MSHEPGVKIGVSEAVVENILKLLDDLSADQQNEVLSSVRTLLKSKRETQIVNLLNDAEYLKASLNNI